MENILDLKLIRQVKYNEFVETQVNHILSEKNIDDLSFEIIEVHISTLINERKIYGDIPNKNKNNNNFSSKSYNNNANKHMRQTQKYNSKQIENNITVGLVVVIIGIVIFVVIKKLYKEAQEKKAMAEYSSKNKQLAKNIRETSKNATGKNKEKLLTYANRLDKAGG
jgi:beta-lactamase regulating signal transducer with metallopeptidase domain